MPPDIIPIPDAVDDGKSARAWLESQGLIAQVPTIRSSDFGLVNECRFKYYLTRRLGLVPALAWSKALSRGSWLHKRLECLQVEKPESFMESAFKAREEELRAICKTFDLGPETIAKVVDRERQDMLNAWAWFDSASRFKLPAVSDLRAGFLGYLRRYRILGHEVTLRYRDPRYPRTHLVAQIDLLLYNEHSCTLWPLDLKSHTGSTIARAQAIRIDMQPRHYLHVTNEMLPDLVAKYKLPDSTRVGGMVHLIIQKPAIQLNQKDRRYTWTSESKRSKRIGVASLVAGKWTMRLFDEQQVQIGNTLTGLTEDEAKAYVNEHVGTIPKKISYGEPLRELFEARLDDWYFGRGDYADDRAEREADPPVNISHTPASILLDEARVAQYHAKLRRLYEYATRRANPENFDMEQAGILQYDKPSPYAHFYLQPVSAWPAIIRRQQFIQQWRDESVDPSAPSQIL